MEDRNTESHGPDPTPSVLGRPLPMIGNAQVGLLDGGRGVDFGFRISDFGFRISDFGFRIYFLALFLG
jgi:hypothetical protein